MVAGERGPSGSTMAAEVLVVAVAGAVKVSTQLPKTRVGAVFPEGFTVTVQVTDYPSESVAVMSNVSETAEEVAFIVKIYVEQSNEIQEGSEFQPLLVAL